LMFFTDTGRVYVERVYNIPEGSRTSKGRSIKNFLNLQPEEKIAATLRIEAHGQEDKDATFVDSLFVLFATRSGKVKKTCLSDFRNYRKDGIIAINIEEGNALISVVLTTGEDELCLVTNQGYCVRCKETDIRSMGRNSAGVMGIRPRGDDYLVSLTVVAPDAQLLVASEKGLGKRTPFEDYPTKGRGGKGVITMNVTDKTGLVIGALRVTDEDDVMLMTDGGQSVRIRAMDIRVTGRNAQGVKLMNLKEGESIQDIARVVSDDTDEDEGSDAPEAPTEGGEAAES
ncbi:MAG: DNA gyrase subunit A, partial [Verrucomicrobiae bacterium]|nr:DNA gyrase subunit A [Verrucomicrobiae bacterium]